MPDACPACGTPVERPAGRGDALLPQRRCPGRVLEGIVHFASRGAMDIRGLGYERVRQLLDAGLIARRGRSLRAHGRAARRARPVRRAVGRAAGVGDRGVQGSSRCRSCSSGSASATWARPWPQLLARRFGTMAGARVGHRRGGHQRGARHRPRDRRGGGGVLRREAQPDAHRAGWPTRDSTSPSRAPDPPMARWPGRPTSSPAPFPRCRGRMPPR